MPERGCSLRKLLWGSVAHRRGGSRPTSNAEIGGSLKYQSRNSSETAASAQTFASTDPAPRAVGS
jgi:hypothetical protein